MNKAFQKGFMKRAMEHGYSVKEANQLLQKAPAYKTNNEISAGINSINNNPGKMPGSAQ